MKKLIEFIKSKEKEKSSSDFEKKASPKTEKKLSTTDQAMDSTKPHDLFWDGYSDIGYC